MAVFLSEVSTVSVNELWVVRTLWMSAISKEPEFDDGVTVVGDMTGERAGIVVGEMSGWFNCTTGATVGLNAVSITGVAVDGD